VEELGFATAAAPTDGTVALRALEIVPTPVADRAPRGVDEASDGGVPIRVGVSLPRCPALVAAAETPVVLAGLPVLIPLLPAFAPRPNPVALAETELRGVAALELWIVPDRQGALCDPWTPARPDGMAEEEFGESCPRDVGEIEPLWKPDEEVAPTAGVRISPAVPRKVDVLRGDAEGEVVEGPRLPRGVALRLVVAPPPSGTALRYVERDELLPGVEVLGETADGERGAAAPEEVRPEGAENLDVNPVLGVAL